MVIANVIQMIMVICLAHGIYHSAWNRTSNGYQQSCDKYINEEMKYDKFIVEGKRVLFISGSVEFCKSITRAVSEILMKRYIGFPRQKGPARICGTDGTWENRTFCHGEIFLASVSAKLTTEIFNQIADEIQNLYFVIESGYNFEQDPLKSKIREQDEEIARLRMQIEQKDCEIVNNQNKLADCEKKIAKYDHLRSAMRDMLA